MEEDDDILLVIIDKENGEDFTFPFPVITKLEQLDEIESKLPVEVIIETAEKYGRFLDLGLDSKCHESEYLEEEVALPETIPEINTIEYFPLHNEDYIMPKKSEIKNSAKKIRKLIVKPEEQKSFVADLRDQYPELRKNRKMLVNSLCVIMKNVKPPPPPDNYCIEVDKVFECTICGTVTDSINASSRHYQEKHGPRYLICYACGDDFRSTTNLYKHEKRCTAPDARIVLQARATCIGSKGRSRPYLHLRKNAPLTISKFYCSLCSASFNTKHNLISHENMHKGVRPYQCHVCPAAYTSNSALLRHVNKHSDAQFICDHCKRAFKVKMALVAHMATHQPQRKYGCEECERRFAQRSALQLHVNRVHKNLPPPCACEICPKRYTRMSLLKTHMENEHGLQIMTRKMFFKKLPMLSSNEVKQAAKLVFRTDTKPPIKKIEDDLPYDDHEEETDEHEESEIIVPDKVSSEDFIHFLNRLQNPDDSKRENKMLLIENGEITNMNSVSF